MDARVVDGDTRAALETARFVDRGPPRLTRAAFPMRVTVEGHASTLELAVPR